VVISKNYTTDSGCARLSSTKMRKYRRAKCWSEATGTDNLPSIPDPRLV
jgi:hypothetical protein